MVMSTNWLRTSNGACVLGQTTVSFDTLIKLKFTTSVLDLLENTLNLVAA